MISDAALEFILNLQINFFMNLCIQKLVEKSHRLLKSNLSPKTISKIWRKLVSGPLILIRTSKPKKKQQFLPKTKQMTIKNVFILLLSNTIYCSSTGCY